MFSFRLSAMFVRTRSSVCSTDLFFFSSSSGVDPLSRASSAEFDFVHVATYNTERRDEAEKWRDTLNLGTVCVSNAIIINSGISQCFCWRLHCLPHGPFSHRLFLCINLDKCTCFSWTEMCIERERKKTVLQCAMRMNAVIAEVLVRNETYKSSRIVVRQPFAPGVSAFIYFCQCNATDLGSMHNLQETIVLVRSEKEDGNNNSHRIEDFNELTWWGWEFPQMLCLGRWFSIWII